MLQEPTSQVTQLRLAAAQLHAEYVITEFHALKKQANIEQQEFDSKINKLTKTREELQKAMEEQGKVGCQVILASSFVCCNLLLCVYVAVQ